MREQLFKFRPIYLLFVGFLLFFSMTGCSLAPKTPSPKISAKWKAELERNRVLMAEPNPRLSPDQVVKIQLGALKNNDREDRGIEVTFKFASPSNRRFTGPVQRFGRMIKSSYSLMLKYESVEYDPVKIVGDQALQRVRLFDTRGNAIVYVFILSKQHEGDCAGCWMTDGVTVERIIPMTRESA